jgi:hypothetical protein
MAEGYGVSGVSGWSQSRLEVIPDAIGALEEEQAFESNSWN